MTTHACAVAPSVGIGLEEARIRISGVVNQSIVDGPGLRMTVFAQGCPHHCAGCHNPATHDFAAGFDCRVDVLLAVFDRNPLLAGVTLSGGEPFARPGELIPLAEQVRLRGKNVWCYSGYTFEELLARSVSDADVAELLAQIDVLVDGRYEEGRRNLSLRFRGSENQRILDLPASLRVRKAVPIAL